MEKYETESKLKVVESFLDGEGDTTVLETSAAPLVKADREVVPVVPTAAL